MKLPIYESGVDDGDCDIAAAAVDGGWLLPESFAIVYKDEKSP